MHKGHVYIGRCELNKTKKTNLHSILRVGYAHRDTKTKQTKIRSLWLFTKSRTHDPRYNGSYSEHTAPASRTRPPWTTLTAGRSWSTISQFQVALPAPESSTLVFPQRLTMFMLRLIWWEQHVSLPATRCALDSTASGWTSPFSIHLILANRFSHLFSCHMSLTISCHFWARIGTVNIFSPSTPLLPDCVILLGPSSIVYAQWISLNFHFLHQLFDVTITRCVGGRVLE